MLYDASPFTFFLLTLFLMFMLYILFSSSKVRLSTSGYINVFIKIWTKDTTVDYFLVMEFFAKQIQQKKNMVN